MYVTHHVTGGWLCVLCGSQGPDRDQHGLPGADHHAEQAEVWVCWSPAGLTESWYPHVDGHRSDKPHMYLRIQPFFLCSSQWYCSKDMHHVLYHKRLILNASGCILSCTLADLALPSWDLITHFQHQLQNCILTLQLLHLVYTALYKTVVIEHRVGTAYSVVVSQHWFRWL